MNLLRTILVGITATKARGIVLAVLAAGLGFAFCYANSGGSDQASADIDAIAIPPLVKAGPTGSPPRPAYVIPDAAASDAVVAQPSDRAFLVRELQAALARAQCYGGPINGVWTDASRDAMGAFVVAVNAQLPIDDPDQTLLALIESNDAATCASGHPLYTGALGPRTVATTEAPPAPSLPAVTATPQPTPNSAAAPAPADGHSMLEHAWAPPEMLIPPKDMTPPPAPAAPITVGKADEIQSSDETAPSAKPNPPATAPVIHFEDSKPILQPDPETAAVPDPRSPNADSNSDPDDAGTKTTRPTKTAQKKSKAKRRPKDDDYSTSIGKGIDTLQRSLSSIFD